MVKKLCPAHVVFVVMVLFCVPAAVQATGKQAPAGQMCPEGGYVIGFDSDSNIICSGVDSTVVPEAMQAAVLVESQGGDDCPPDCPPVVTVDSSEVATETPLNQQDIEPGVAIPVISKVKPRSVVFGAKETSITITGNGFNADSVVKFQGKTYAPSVNTTGTELHVTIATRDLAMGPYAISVSNGADLETTRPRALEVY